MIFNFINLNHLFLYYIISFLFNNLIISLFFLIINIIIIFFFNSLYLLMINLFLVSLIISIIMVIMIIIIYFLFIFFIIILISYLYLQIIILSNNNPFVYPLLSYILFSQINYSINLSKFFMNELFKILFLIHLLKLLKFYDLEEIHIQIKHPLDKKHWKYIYLPIKFIFIQKYRFDKLSFLFISHY